MSVHRISGITKFIVFVFVAVYYLKETLSL